MNKNWHGPYSLVVGVLLVFSSTIPAFAEVIKLDTTSNSFFKDEKITFSGTVEKGTTGLVSIVIRDIDDRFVLLTQAIINSDNSFEKTISIEESFSDDGRYNATGFILTLAKGVTTQFEVSLDTIRSELSVQDNRTIEIQENTQTQQSISEPVFEPIREPEPVFEPIREPEPEPSREIKEVQTQVQNLIDNEIIPEAEALSTIETTSTPSNNSETAQIFLAIAGLGILFGAVYGIKRKVDDNSKQIYINRDILKKKIIQPIRGSNPQTILQTRLAKGEITLQEYDILKSKIG